VGSARVDEAALVAWGREFARALRPPVVVGLSGELGTGKTTLVKAIAAGLGVRQHVTSPSFALVHRYDGEACVVLHVDGYRLTSAGELRDLGIQDALEGEDSPVVLIEWPERLGATVPRPDHHLRLAYTDDPGFRSLSW
jgi:tRNA threonylcarbamoyladenosine biosynthesis protein TsaE